MHFVNQDTNCFRIGVLVDAVAKVKDMAAIADLAEAVDYAARFTTDASLVGKKHCWIKVALQRYRILYTGSSLGEVHRSGAAF